MALQRRNPRCAVNRRMDDWVQTADLDLSTVEPEIVEVRRQRPRAKSGGRKQHAQNVCLLAVFCVPRHTDCPLKAPGPMARTAALRLRQMGPDGKIKKKARVEEHSSDEEHGDFDPQQLREHEEFTKVRARGLGG